MDNDYKQRQEEIVELNNAFAAYIELMENEIKRLVEMTNAVGRSPRYSLAVDYIARIAKAKKALGL